MIFIEQKLAKFLKSVNHVRGLEQITFHFKQIQKDATIGNEIRHEADAIYRVATLKFLMRQPTKFIVLLGSLFVFFIIALAEFLVFLNFYQTDWFKVGVGLFSSLIIFTLPLTLLLFLGHRERKTLLNKIFFYFLVALYSFTLILDLLLILFRLTMNYQFDFYFFWYNRSVTFDTLNDILAQPKLTLSFFALLFVVLMTLLSLLTTKLNFLKIKKGGISILLLILIPLQILGWFVLPIFRGELVNFLTGIAKPAGQIEKLYETKYRELITKQKENLNTLKIENPRTPSIFFIHLESLNSALVSAKITPNFWRYAETGIFLPRFYSNSVQTIRAEESILCGLAPTINYDLERRLSGDFPAPRCLPAILNDLGYQTEFFKSDNLGFMNTDVFMNKIGFGKQHYRDIIAPDAVEEPWGVREDYFYQGVLNYLKSNSAGKLFSYVAVSSTNHFPFSLPQDLSAAIKNELPFNPPRSEYELLADTTHLQDSYLPQIIDPLRAAYPNAYIFLYGDHPWPASVARPAGLNFNGAFEENFLTSMIILTPEKKIETVETRFGHSDILPTILEILGAKNQKLYGQSIFSGKNHCIFNNQPFSEKFITLTDYPEKYIFDLSRNLLTQYDLARDPKEKNPIEQRTINFNQDKILIENCFSD
jgi:hypothetical protein